MVPDEYLVTILKLAEASQNLVAVLDLGVPTPRPVDIGGRRLRAAREIEGLVEVSISAADDLRDVECDSAAQRGFDDTDSIEYEIADRTCSQSRHPNRARGLHASALER